MGHNNSAEKGCPVLHNCMQELALLYTVKHVSVCINQASPSVESLAKKFQNDTKLALLSGLDIMH